MYKHLQLWPHYRGDIHASWRQLDQLTLTRTDPCAVWTPCSMHQFPILLCSPNRCVPLYGHTNKGPPRLHSLHHGDKGDIASKHYSALQWFKGIVLNHTHNHNFFNIKLWYTCNIFMRHCFPYPLTLLILPVYTHLIIPSSARTIYLYIYICYFSIVFGCYLI